jgi:hypothetical protein
MQKLPECNLYQQYKFYELWWCAVENEQQSFVECQE